MDLCEHESDADEFKHTRFCLGLHCRFRANRGTKDVKKAVVLVTNTDEVNKEKSKSTLTGDTTPDWHRSQ